MAARGCGQWGAGAEEGPARENIKDAGRGGDWALCNGIMMGEHRPLKGCGNIFLGEILARVAGLIPKSTEAGEQISGTERTEAGWECSVSAGRVR